MSGVRWEKTVIALRPLAAGDRDKTQKSKFEKIEISGIAKSQKQKRPNRICVHEIDLDIVCCKIAFLSEDHRPDFRRLVSSPPSAPCASARCIFKWEQTVS